MNSNSVMNANEMQGIVGGAYTMVFLLVVGEGGGGVICFCFCKAVPYGWYCREFDLLCLFLIACNKHACLLYTHTHIHTHTHTHTHTHHTHIHTHTHTHTALPESTRKELVDAMDKWAMAEASRGDDDTVALMLYSQAAST